MMNVITPTIKAIQELPEGKEAVTRKFRELLKYPDGRIVPPEVAFMALHSSMRDEKLWASLQHGLNNDRIALDTDATCKNNVMFNWWTHNLCPVFTSEQFLHVYRAVIKFRRVNLIEYHKELCVLQHQVQKAAETTRPTYTVLKTWAEVIDASQTMEPPYLVEQALIDEIMEAKSKQTSVCPADLVDRELFGKIEKIEQHQSFYSDGTLKHERNLKDGKPHGVERYWYQDGTLQYEHVFVDGKLHGLEKGWFQSGMSEYERNYKDGKYHGLVKNWYPDGTPEYERNYVDGKPHGVERHWFPDGTLKLADVHT